MIILPAIDLLDGQCVRLKKGVENTAKQYSSNPPEMARQWQSLGSKYLHLVNLDGAFGRSEKNIQVIKDIVNAIDIPVELGGGIRTEKDVVNWLNVGVSRVIIGTAAINSPELVSTVVEKFGAEKIVVGIDARDNKVAVDGWETQTSKDVYELALEMKSMGVVRIVYTDVNRDGALTGPNIDNTVNLAFKTGLKVIASGGFANCEQFQALADKNEPNIDGAIVGTAIYENKVDLQKLNDMFK